MWGFTSKLWILCLCATSILTGCNRSPERMVKKYLDYTFLDNNGKDAYDLLSAEDKAYISCEDFSKSVRRTNVLNKKVLDKYENYFFYEIVDTRETTDTFYVTAELNRPNAFYILSDLVGYAMVTSFGSLPENDRMQAIGKKFDAIMMSKNRLVTSEEKVFKLIKENNRYRIFLDAGAGEKMRKKKAAALQLMSEAEEHEKSINYEKALQLYAKAFSLSNQEMMLEKKQNLEKRSENLLHLGQVKVFGNVLFKPLRIEKMPVAGLTPDSNAIRQIGLKPDHTVMVLTYSLRNVSEGQVFKPVRLAPVCTSTISDNFGNLMEGYNLCLAEQNVHIKPGESKVYRAVCETPLTDLARKFVWKVRINVDNAGRQEDIYIRFDKDGWNNELVSNK